MKLVLKENRGYALLTVLMAITIFGVLSLAFITNSLNSSKQTSLIEKNSQSVGLAEMGAKYFQYAVKNASSTVLPGIITQVQNERTEDLHNKINKSKDEYTQRAMTLLSNELSKEIIPTTVPIKDVGNTSFKIENITFEPNNSTKVLKVTSKSIGNKNGEESAITTSVSINFTDLISVVQTEVQDTTFINNLPKGNEIIVPSDLSTCDNSKDFTSRNCQFSGDKYFENNDNDIKFYNSIVKFTGLLNIPGNMNNTITSSTLFIEDDLSFKRQVNFNKSKLYVRGIPDFDESVNFSNESVVYFGEDGNIKFNFNFNDSDLYAAKDVFFKKPSKIENQSNVNIRGFADFEETVEILGGTKGSSNVYFEQADFKKNFTLDNSKLHINNSPINSTVVYFKETAELRNRADLFIGTNTYFKKNLKLFSGSILYIDGNAEFDETLDFSGGSKLCVNGHFELKNNRNINKDSASKIYAKSSNNSNVNVNGTDFNNACKRDTKPAETYNWGELVINPEFRYNYE